MYKIVKIFALVVSLVLATGLAAADQKIAVLDMQQAVINSDLAQKRLKALRDQAEFKGNMNELEKLQKEHNDMVTKLQKDRDVMGTEQLQAHVRRIEEKRGDIEHVGRKLQSAERQLLQQIVQELGPALQRAVTEIIEAEGVGLVLDASAVLHATTQFDITAKVTDRLNRAR